ncbi:hypothetical protein JD969_16805 [Planctomycetota bacterium]|nr:hypothetical protein JD969_16805 [Planctomycetota bacterium]
MKPIFYVLVLSISLLLVNAHISAQSESSTFQLNKLSFENITVHYESVFEGRRDDIQSTIEQFAQSINTESQRQNWLNTDGQSLLQDIYKILGFTPTKPQLVEHKNLLKQYYLDLPPFDRHLHLYLVTKQNSKIYLRTGGTIPAFHYIPEEDAVAASIELDSQLEKQSIAIPLVVDINDELQIALQKQLSKFSDQIGLTLDSSFAAIGIHELAEGIVGMYVLGPDSPHYRWFTDGIAEAITFELTSKYFGKNVYDYYSSRNTIDEYKHLKKQINLAYWLRADLEIDTAFQSESDIKLARYVFARHELQYLIKTHSLASIAAIIHELQQLTDPKDKLFIAIQNATGTDMHQRMFAYQSFNSRDEGIIQYAKQYTTTIKNKQYKKALIAHLRLNELQGGLKISSTATAIQLLHKLGQTHVANQLQTQKLTWLKQNNQHQNLIMLKHYILTAAIKFEQHNLFTDLADEMLLRYADNPSALTVRMLNLADQDNLKDAQDIARQIIKLNPDPLSHWHFIAQSMLNRSADLKPDIDTELQPLPSDQYQDMETGFNASSF